MTLILNRETEELIQKKVESGKYASASDVVTQTLRLLEERDREYEEKMEALRRDIKKGLDDLQNGRYFVLDQNSKAEIEAMIRREGMKQLEEMHHKAI